MQKIINGMNKNNPETKTLFQSKKIMNGECVK